MAKSTASDTDPQKHEVIWLPLTEIHPYERNAKTHPEEQIARLVKMLAKGFDQPIVVDKNRVIIKGHGRLLAAKRLGLAGAPVIVRSDLSAKEVKAHRLGDNQNALSPWDMTLAKLDLDELRFDDFDMDVTGFSEWTLPTVVSEHERSTNPTDDLETDLYTKKILAPVYIPKLDVAPEVTSLTDFSKTNELLEGIRVMSSELSEGLRDFLRAAAARHTVFDYQLIAEYYAHAPKSVQELMEQSALVIIDFNKAIENGFVSISQEIADAYGEVIKDESVA